MPTTGKFHVYRDRYNDEGRISCTKAHVQPCQSCRDRPDTHYPNGYMD